MLVALIQTEILDFEIEKNLKNLTEICKNILEDVDLIIFPEMFLTGFVTDISFAQESMEKGLAFIHQLQKEKSCAVEGSLLCEVEDKNKANKKIYYNRHYFITQDNEYHYDKQKLFSLSDESKILTAGTKSTIAELKDWKINLKTCYDLRFCDICKNEIDMSDSYSQTPKFKYDIITFVASWPKSRSNQWKILLQARAIENQCYSIGVNRYGTDSLNNEYSGDSCVVDMKGNFLEPLPYSTKNILYFDINKENLHSSRKKFPIYADW